MTTDIPALPEDSVFDRIVDDLSLRFTGTFGRETVERCVTECRRLLTSTATTTRLASRTASFATERLSAMASERSPAEGMPEVLFVCVQNAGRSQMAAALLRRLAGDRIHVRTAGSQPAARVSPAIVDALEELGVPIGDEFPKPLTDDVVRAADVVVTLGCGDACPVYAGTRYLDWDLPDPVGRTSDEVRAIRDALDERVRGLLVSLLPRTS
ncbi:arsenate reductase [Agromyces sp. Leaf222]|nr:arsenate reductase [Agromyces sp. Leaf222]